MRMVSYWKDTKEFFEDDGLVFIIGRYDHKNQNNGGNKALGVHWGDYPQSNGVLCPCVIPEITRNAILSGLLHQGVTKNETGKVESILDAIKFFQ